jgi:demethylmenaquinone methyltransferase/2-methoxy-6-polyprenyl-1,4-benzoquinol methylase
MAPESGQNKVWSGKYAMTECDPDADRDLKPGFADNTVLTPHPILTRYYANERERRTYVTRLFDSAAQHYDWINRVMSLGTGHMYRRQALLRMGLSTGMRVLDVGCGTGVIAQHAAGIVGSQGCVVGLDPSIGMLYTAAQQRVPHAVQGLGEALPFMADSFDALTMGYALRHVSDLGLAFREYRRVLKPGGRVLLLELVPPTSRFLYILFKLYMKWLIPILTGLCRHSREARTMMAYFWDTIDQCVPPETILAMLQSAEFEQIERHVRGGVFSEYSARKT